MLDLAGHGVAPPGSGVPYHVDVPVAVIGQALGADLDGSAPSGYLRIRHGCSIR